MIKAVMLSSKKQLIVWNETSYYICECVNTTQQQWFHISLILTTSKS